MLTAFLKNWFSSFSFFPEKILVLLCEVLAVLLLALALYFIAKVLKAVFSLIFKHSFFSAKFPRLIKAMEKAHFFERFSWAVAAVATLHLYKIFIPAEGILVATVIAKMVGTFVVCCFMGLVICIINMLDAIYGKNPNIPLKGVFQAGKIIVYLLGALVIISILISKKPMYVITGLSAAAAVFMLIFKDPILGFAAGIQLASNNLLKIGDWITMPSHGADGTVVDITLTTVRVQNFDNTLVNIPAYDLVSRPFQNWSGMFQSGARRIKRAINIDVETIKFLDAGLLKRLKKIKLISGYLADKEAEILAFNEQHGNKESVLNGRHLTNIGTFRQYALAYLNSLSTINHEQTCMVRQLSPTTAGLPLEIYCFTATTEWEKYEVIQADIFDHLYSVMPEFGLFPYQQPAGRNVAAAARLWTAPSADKSQK